jgi:hypothetical protein
VPIDIIKSRRFKRWGDLFSLRNYFCIKYGCTFKWYLERSWEKTKKIIFCEKWTKTRFCLFLNFKFNFI